MSEAVPNLLPRLMTAGYQYRDAIDAQAGRDSHAGRRVLSILQDRSGEILSTGASDWIVRPRAGGYPADEAAFLRTILHTIATTLSAEPDILARHDLAEGVLEDWLATRRRQLVDRSLIYVAHQYDILYQGPR